MSRQEHFAWSVARRCKTICTAVGLVRSTGIDFVQQVVDAFPTDAEGPASERAWRQRAYLLIQAFHGRLPAHQEDAALRACFGRGSVAALHEALVTHPDAAAPQAAAELVKVAAGVPILDVTYTAQVDFTSGIQRVVRSLAQHLPEVVPGALLVRWDDRSRGFVPLVAEEVATVRSPPPRPIPSPVPDASVAARAWRALARAADWPRWRIERTIRRHRRRAEERRLCQPTVFLWREPLVLPELIGGTLHLEAVRLVTEATPVRTTLVFYDALPVRRAELFAAHTHSVYLRTLSLLRHVEAVSCISHAVRKNLESLLDVLPDRWPPPRIAVHHLGADFGTCGSTGSVAGERPIVLCVGTIEPRKNQRRILRAMVKAQAAGADFLGLFVGNAGWLDGPFRQEFAAAVAGGHRLALQECVADDELHALYAQAAFTVYCSLDEGLGLPIIESVRRGRPCLTSDRGSMREVADITGGCLLVDPENTAAIAAAIGRLVSDPRLLGRLTREAAAATWPSWREYTRELLDFARGAAAGIAAPRAA